LTRNGFDWWRKPQSVDNQMRIANRWNPLNLSINYDYSGTKVVCNFPKEMADLRLWLCYRGWKLKIVTDIDCLE
jgi:ribosomal protein L32E